MSSRNAVIKYRSKEEFKHLYMKVQKLNEQFYKIHSEGTIQ